MTNTVIIGKPRPSGVTVIKDETPSGTATVAGPGTGGSSGQTREQAFLTPQAQWIFNHNLGYYPSIEILSLARQEVSAQVDHISANQVRVSFNNPFAGYILYG